MLEDRTLPSGTAGALDAFLLTPMADSTPIAVHIHPHLTIQSNGQDQVIPTGIGLTASGDLPIHTHDDSGTIHIESPVAQDFTLQNFFTVWGQTFSSQNILGHQVDAADPLVMTVNGQVSSAWGSLVLHDQDNIVIQYGSASKATLTTDRPDYSPGTTAVFSGSGFSAGESVTLQVTHIDGRSNTDASHTPWTVVADASGAIQTTWVVNPVDAVGSTLEVKSLGQSSHASADAIFTDSTNPPVARPFWIFAHNPDSEAVTQEYLQKGVNGLEPDIEYFSQSKIDAINTARILLGVPALTAQPGFYIAHGNFKLEETSLGSAYELPILPLTDYLTWLSGYLSAGQTQLSLIAFDVKTAAAQAPDAIGTILSDIATNLLAAHPEIRSIINVGSQADATSLFTSAADSLFAALPTTSNSLAYYKKAIGFSIDGEDDVTATSAKLRSLLGSDALIGFGDGSAGCCNPAIGVFGLNAFFAPNTPGALARAAFERTASGDLNVVTYAYSVHGTDSMKMLIDQGVDGLIPADNVDPTSNLALAGITSSFSKFGDTTDALAVVNGHYDNVYLATTADDPFSVAGAKSGVVTGSRDGYALEVKTSDVSGAGTDANITFTLHGVGADGKATAASITLDTSWSQMMERNDVNYVFIPSADLGTLKSVTVSNDGSGGKWGISLNSEWNLDYIKVRSFAYIGHNADDFYSADYGGQDVGDPICLGILCIDKADQNPSTRALTIGNYLTATSRATGTGGVEGVTGATLADATFHDRNTVNTSFSVTAVDWGDGSTDATGLTISGSNGDYTVNGSHLYKEQGNYAFSITVKAGGIGPDANKSATINGEVDVSDPAVALTAASFQATEGALSAVQTLATFTDPGGPEALADYTAEVDWGNGTFVAGDANVSINAPVAGVFTVTGRHLYADEDGYPGPIQVRINHEGSTPSTVVAVPLILTDPTVNATGATSPFRATEGTMSAAQTLATFTDPGGPETLSEYSVDMDWGNGTFVSGDTNISMSGPVAGVFTVTGHHLYADEDGYTGPIRVRINHEGGTPSTVVSVPLTLTDPAVIATGATGPFGATEGTVSAVQTVATFTDPGGPEAVADYRATISWDDGKSSTGSDVSIVLGSDGKTYSIRGSHTYADEGRYTVRVHITHENAIAADTTTTAIVAENVPVITATSLSQEQNPHNASLTVSYSDTAVEGHYLLVNWGDTVYDTLYLGIAASGSFTQTHHYQGGDDSAKHQATVVVSLLDDEGTAGAPVAQTIKFNNGQGGKTDAGANTFLIQGPSDGVPGQTRTYELRFDPTAPVTSQTGTTFAVTWGDGTSQTVAALSGLLVQHVYKTTGAYTVQLTATDSLGHLTVLASKAVPITAVALEVDPLDSDRTVLAVGGNSAGSTITIDRAALGIADRPSHNDSDGENSLAVTIDGVMRIYSAPEHHDFSRIVVYAQAGNNTIVISDKVTLLAELHGGSGTDYLHGGGGGAILIGGSGTETLIGGLGPNLIIGGLGKSTLIGGPGGDLLIGGATAYDQNEAALLSIFRRWNQGNDYLERIAVITGIKNDDAKQGGYFLNQSTVYDDLAADTLTGNGGRNWYWAGPSDQITNRKSNEVVNLPPSGH